MRAGQRKLESTTSALAVAQWRRTSARWPRRWASFRQNHALGSLIPPNPCRPMNTTGTTRRRRREFYVGEKFVESFSSTDVLKGLSFIGDRAQWYRASSFPGQAAHFPKAGG